MDNIYNNNFYSLGIPAWHKKGKVGKNGQSAGDVYSGMEQIDFEIRPFGIELNGSFNPTGKHFGIVKVGKGREVVIGECKGRYSIVQPREYVELFDKHVAEPVETLGFLGTNAQRMFITWSLPSINIHGDKVELYGFLALGFDGKFGEQLYQTNVRVVCNNTWNNAVSNAEKDGGAVYRGKHTVKDHAERLGAWMNYITVQSKETRALFEKLYTKMDNAPVMTDDAYRLLEQVYVKKEDIAEFYPDSLREKDQVKVSEHNLKADEKIDLAMSLFKGAGIEIAPTAWGLFNAVTELENHRIPSKKDATESLLLGNRRLVMGRALSVIGDFAERY